MGISKWLNDAKGGVSERPDGSILPSGMNSVRAPTMGADQRKQLESIQALLGKGAEQSIQGLLGQGQSPIDKYAISSFERDIMPQITQGAAHNNLLGASGVAGAQADATSRLSEGLAAQKYSAIGDLLGKYGQFSQISPYKYSAYQSPQTDWGSVAKIFAGGDKESGWGEWLGEKGGAGIGAIIGKPEIGGLIGKTGGKGIDWLVKKLFSGSGKGSQSGTTGYSQEIDMLLGGQQY
jgi:hypothetical protein